MAQLEGLVLNSKKLELKRPRVSFFGAEYSTDGMHPCPKKIQGITKITPPIDKQQLASFIGMVTYMGDTSWSTDFIKYSADIPKMRRDHSIAVP